MEIQVRWRIGSRADDEGDREVAIFVAEAEGERRAVARLGREELEARVAGMGDECPAYYREALAALRG